jgi:hypothetical protein
MLLNIYHTQGSHRGPFLGGNKLAFPEVPPGCGDCTLLGVGDSEEVELEVISKEGTDHVVSVHALSQESSLQKTVKSKTGNAAHD